MKYKIPCVIQDGWKDPVHAIYVFESEPTNGDEVLIGTETYTITRQWLDGKLSVLLEKKHQGLIPA